MSNRNSSWLLLSLLISGTSVAYGAEKGVIETVAIFTNTKFTESSAKFEILLNDKSEIQNFRWVATNQTVAPIHTPEAVVKGTTLETFNAPVIGTLETIILKGSKINYDKGEGTLTFRFLNDGMARLYLECQMVIKRSEDGVWQLFNATGKTKNEPITKAKMVVDPNKGIASVEGLNCVMDHPVQQQADEQRY